MMCAVASQAAADIKVGVLHSLSGTMAISETTLKDTMLMLIEQQNAKGVLLGEKLVPVVVDPASDWPLFAEKARELLTVSARVCRERELLVSEQWPAERKDDCNRKRKLSGEGENGRRYTAPHNERPHRRASITNM